MAQGACFEVGLEVVIYYELTDVFIHRGGAAFQCAVGMSCARCNRLERQVVAQVTQVLAELPDIVDPPLEGVAQPVVGAVVVFPVRVAEVLVVGNLAERRVVLGSAQRWELAGDAGIVAVELAEEGQPGVVVDVPGQARGDVVALVVDMVDLGVAVAHHAGDAIEKASSSSSGPVLSKLTCLWL